MELTLNTKDCGCTGHVPARGLLLGTEPNTQTTTQITTSKKITRPCFILRTGKAGKSINYINNPGHRSTVLCPIYTLQSYEKDFIYIDCFWDF
jgi:hypothetical protein